MYFYHLYRSAELLVMIDNKKKGIFIEEDKFISRINSIYIDEDLLQLCRQLIELKLLKEKNQLNQDSKRNKKSLEVECDIYWPICFKALKEHKSDLGEIQVWTFKEEGSFKLITDYLILKNKKSYKPLEDYRTDEKKLQIGRIPHACNVTEYNKKQNLNQQSFELEQYDIFNRKMVISSLLVWGSKINIQNSHISFFKKATSQNLSLLEEETQRANSASKIELKNQKNQQKQISKRSTEKISDKQSAKLERGSKVQDEDQKQPKSEQKCIQSQKQIIEEGNEEIKKTRNPFKKLRNKWRQRKTKNLQE